MKTDLLELQEKLNNLESHIDLAIIVRAKMHTLLFEAANQLTDLGHPNKEIDNFLKSLEPTKHE